MSADSWLELRFSLHDWHSRNAIRFAQIFLGGSAPLSYADSSDLSGCFIFESDTIANELVAIQFCVANENTDQEPYR